MLCRLRQFKISSAIDDGRDLPSHIRKHIDRCPRCGEFWRNTLLLKECLHDESANAPAPPSSRRASWFRPVVTSTAAAVLIGAMGAWVFLQNYQPPQPTPPASHAQAQQPADGPVVGLNPAEDAIALAQTYLTVLHDAAQRRMMNEFEGLSADLRTALVTVARNVPSVTYNNPHT